MNINKPNLSRRDFFKAGSIIVGGIAVASALTPFDGVLFATERPKGKGKWYGIGIDINKCIGCGKCASACKLENNVPKDPFYFRSWVEQYTIKNDGTVLVESPMAELMVLNNLFRIPIFSNHSLFPKCATIAPNRHVCRFARWEQHSKLPKALYWWMKIIA